MFALGEPFAKPLVDPTTGTTSVPSVDIGFFGGDEGEDSRGTDADFESSDDDDYDTDVEVSSEETDSDDE